MSPETITLEYLQHLAYKRLQLALNPAQPKLDGGIFPRQILAQNDQPRVERTEYYDGNGNLKRVKVRTISR